MQGSKSPLRGGSLRYYVIGRIEDQSELQRPKCGTGRYGRLHDVEVCLELHVHVPYYCTGPEFRLYESSNHRPSLYLALPIEALSCWPSTTTNTPQDVLDAPLRRDLCAATGCLQHALRCAILL